MVSAIAVPFFTQVPAAETLPAAASVLTSASGSGATASSSGDTVSIRPVLSAGTFTAEAGDAFSLSTLVQASLPSGQTLKDYEIALGGAGDGTLLLNGQDVSSQRSFTAAQFAQLQYIAGGGGTTQNILVVAQSDSGYGPTDSPAVQITASVTGTRSLNALPALQTTPASADAATTTIAQQAAIFSGAGNARPGLATAGNFTAGAGDTFNLSGLFQANVATGQTLKDYEVALDGTGDGTLLLNGSTVTSQTSFTAAQFNELQYVAGSSGTANDLLVVAQTEGATDYAPTDSLATSITASVTGATSLNALPALTAPDAGDTATTTLAQQAAIFTGTGGARPSLTPVGDFTAAAGDAFDLGDLFQSNVPSGQTLKDYEVALDGAGDGTLMLNGTDVTTQGTFTAAQFAQLQYVAGSSGTAQNILAVGQTGSGPAPTDSQAVQITATVSGTPSLNALAALQSTPDTDNAQLTVLAQQAAIFTGTGGARPSLSTAGNFTAAAGDAFGLSDLFQGSVPSGQTLRDYEVALDGDSGGTLMLDGADVTTQGTFTAAQFAQLQYVAGSSGSTQDILVVAQTGSEFATDSLATEITADVTGTESLNVLPALQSTPTADIAQLTTLAQQASIFTGTGGARPSLSTTGNFTAASGDAFGLSDLFQSSVPTGQTLKDYEVALDGDSGGTLMLNGTDVTTQGTFTAAQFAQLQYVAGADGGTQDILVDVQTSSPYTTDSPATEITASVTGTESVNALPALQTTPSTADAAFTELAQEASIFTGTGTGRPSIQTVLGADPSQLPAATPVGAFQQTGGTATVAGTYQYAAFDPTQVGAYAQTGTLAAAADSLLDLLFPQQDIGGAGTVGGTTLQTVAIAAYLAAQAV
jgi:hypothetical protein